MYVTELQANTKIECDKYSNDVKFWAEYRTGIKEFSPWLAGAEYRTGIKEFSPWLASKREADPYLLYGGLRTYGYGLGYYGLGHHGVYYGKREAEAAPKAEADPYLRYGGYGLGYGHLGYGYGLGYR